MGKGKAIKYICEGALVALALNTKPKLVRLKVFVREYTD